MVDKISCFSWISPIFVPLFVIFYKMKNVKTTKAASGYEMMNSAKKGDSLKKMQQNVDYSLGKA